MAAATPPPSVPEDQRDDAKGTGMLRILGVQGSPAAKLLVGAALIAFGLWQHGAIAVVIGVGLLLVTAVGVVSSRSSSHDGGHGQGRAR
jgi:hypothetical protein